MQWDAAQYLKFGDERTRAARDLLAHIPLAAPKQIFDLGCGPGNSTELLQARFPQARITGVDSSAEMLAEARIRLPQLAFLHADLNEFAPEAEADLYFCQRGLPMAAQPYRRDAKPAQKPCTRRRSRRANAG